MQATERLWLTPDRSRLVREGDPEAGTLYAAVGDEIPDSAVALFGLAGGRLPRTRKAAAPEAAKEQTGSEDKERKGSEDKGDKAPPAAEPAGGEAGDDRAGGGGGGTEKAAAADPAPKPGLTINKRKKKAKS